MRELIYGQSGAVVIIGAIMAFIKKSWKPEKKEMYWIPAIGLSVIASVAISMMVGWTWMGFGTGVVLIAGGQLFAENEVFAAIKEALLGKVDG